MYLPEDFIKTLLRKADPLLESLPLFLSSTYGTQKTTKELFFDTYHALEYNYGTWIHFGDNLKADGSIPRSLGIKTVNHKIPEMGQYEKELISFIGTYDSYQISSLFTKFQTEKHSLEECYAYCYVSLYWVPYINWSVQHALEQGIETLYFISRDGYHLKRIADTIINERRMPLKTKYIYGSRRAWRLPSQIDRIDDEFFGEFGNFVDIETYDKLLDASYMSEDDFMSMFPELSYLKSEKIITRTQLQNIRSAFSCSEKYKNYLLTKAKNEREIVLRYLKQEIDFSEKFAFVEFWGRGYSQTCLARLIWEVCGCRNDNIFYYARSIYPSDKHLIRYNFTGNNYSQIFIESIFANLPYKTIASYIEDNGKIVPVVRPCDNNQLLHDALEEFLPKFAYDFCQLSLENEQNITRSLFDFGLSYFHNNKNQEIFKSTLAKLNDAVALYSNVQEYAPPITLKEILHWLNGGNFNTKDFNLSFERSAWPYRVMWKCYRKYIHGTKYAQRIKNFRERR